MLPTSITSVGEYMEYMGLGDGFCRHPSPLLVNMWAWVTDAASIRHLCWSNIAWVTDSADIRHLCW